MATVEGEMDRALARAREALGPGREVRVPGDAEPVEIAWRAEGEAPPGDFAGDAETVQGLEVGRIGDGEPPGRAAATTAPASGCSDRLSSPAARVSTASSVRPGPATTSVTRGRPSVRVPVLSKATTRTSRRRCSAAPSRNRMPRLAARAGPDHDGGGRGETHGAGQAMISTATALTRAGPRAGAGARTSQPRKVARAIPITAGTKRPVTRSTSAWIGSLPPWARSTMAAICASTVAAPTASTRRSRLPRPLRVPPTIRSPGPLRTGTDSPVTMLSSTWLEPDRTAPSAATRSPGRTRTTSPMRSSASPTSTSVPSRTTRAVLGARSISRAMAWPVRPRAPASRVARAGSA